MEIKTQETYRCDFCKKLYVRKSAAIKHEIGCSKNPENYRDCFGCTHAKKKVVWIHRDTPMYSDRYLTSLVYCEVKKVYLIPPKTERKGDWYDSDDLDAANVLMLKECTDANYEF